MKVAAENKIFCNHKALSQNEALIAMAFCKKNSTLVNDVFFKLSCSCSWGVADSSTCYYEIANVHYFYGSPADASDYADRLNEIAPNFLMPTYAEYRQVEDMFFREDTSEAIIASTLLNRKAEIRPSQEQYLKMATNYLKYSTFSELECGEISLGNSIQFGDIDNIGRKKGLAFLGLYLRIPAKLNLNMLLSFLVYAKALGGVDSHGIYRKYRDAGLTYAAFSLCTINNNLLATGAILDNNESIFNDICERVSYYRFSSERFAQAKILVWYDLLYACGEVGETMAMLSFSLYCHREISLKTLKAVLDNLSMEEASVILPLPLKKARLDLKSSREGIGS